MFPDNHTLHPNVSDGRRAFLMGNALVCGVVQNIGKSLYRFIYEKEPVSTRPIDMKRDAQPRLYVQHILRHDIGQDNGRAKFTH